MVATTIEGYYIKNIGQNRGIPRIWLEGTQTERAGFMPGHRYDVVVQGQTVVLQANMDGSRIVSSKKAGEKLNPIIDLNSRELLAIFDGMACVRIVVKKGEIVLVPLASELKKQERFKRLRNKLETGEKLTIGSLSHGGGILTHAIHAGLQKAGIETELSFANEIRPELLEHAATHNDAWSENTKIFAAPMQELAFDERGLAHVPQVDLLEFGLPCVGASSAGMAKNALTRPEAHPEAGHLFVSALIILNKTNAAVVVMENVTNYAQTASADVLRLQLRDMGYETHERILNGKQWGALENRDRWCLVAVTKGIEFDFDQLYPPELQGKKLGDVLDPVPLDSARWSEMEGLKAKQERDKAAGKGFMMQVFNENSEHIGTITKGYAKVRSTDPKIAHPTDPKLLRQLYPSEHARIKEVPEHLVEGLCETTAHEVLGQGIVYAPFVGVGQHVGNALNRFGGLKVAPVATGAPVVQKSVSEFSQDVLELASEVVATLKKADDMRGQYIGRIVAVGKEVFIQDAGRNEGIVHDMRKLASMPKLGQEVTVKYKQGQGVIELKEKAQMSLEM
jgi:DNA (cytosine-5)-methyltransferase 1